MENDLEIIPVLNKIDLPAADPDRVAEEIEDTIGLDCSDIVKYSRKDSNDNVVDLYRTIVKMMDKGSVDLDLLVFSGDDDSVCSLAGTQTWIWDLGSKARGRHTWTPWAVDNQTSGFQTRFHLQNKNSSFVFATVHGAGHEVPSYRPKEALELLRRYLHRDW